jgi:Uma2 family endonuclease
MTKPVRTPATYADLEKVPPHLVAEIIHGVLETHPRPLPRHGIVANALGFEVTGPFQKGRGGPGGWIFITEPQLHFRSHVLVPDLAGWRRERMTSLPQHVGITISPDWACEILSPSTAKIDREMKLPIYAEQGVGHVWLIDPDRRFIDAYCNVAGKWVLVGAATGDSDVSLPPFDAITFPMSDLFPFDPSSADEPTKG